MIQKKRKMAEWVFNPEISYYELKEVETDKYVFDETDKIAISLTLKILV